MSYVIFLLKIKHMFFIVGHTIVSHPSRTVSGLYFRLPRKYHISLILRSNQVGKYNFMGYNNNKLYSLRTAFEFTYTKLCYIKAKGGGENLAGFKPIKPALSSMSHSEIKASSDLLELFTASLEKIWEISSVLTFLMAWQKKG